MTGAGANNTKGGFAKRLWASWERFNNKETFAQLCELRVHLAGAQIEPQKECFDAFQLLKDDFDRHFNEVRDKPGRIDFALILSMELRLYQCLATEMLRQKHWLLRQRFKAVVGTAGYEAYQISRPIETASAERDVLLADSLNLLTHIHGAYFRSIAFETRLSRYTALLAGIALVVIATVVGKYYPLLQTSNPTDNGDLIWLIVGSGTLGALISSLRRLDNLNDNGSLDRDLLLDQKRLAYGGIGAIIALVSGVVFSMLVYAIFSSEILGKTAIFPSFVRCNDVQLHCASGIRLFFYGIRPESPQEIAKIVVWSFISGFAERFVPDVLDRLVKKTDKQ